MYFVIDTHALIWYLTSSSKLSKKAREIIQKAERGEGIIIVPTIVLAELLSICEKKNIPHFGRLLEKIEKNTNYFIQSLDLEIIKNLPKIKGGLELHDRIIVTIAQLFKAKIISCDRKIQKIKGLKVIW